MIRLLIVDEQKSIQEKLISLLAKEEEIEILATAANGEIALEKVEKLHPDIVLMDLLMPVMDGLTATQIISQRYPETKILILTGSIKNQNLHQALMAGAKGYLRKTAPREDIIAALHAIRRGCVYFGPHVWQVPSLNSKPQLDSWTNKLAQEIIISWRTKSKQKPASLREILTLLRLVNNQPQPSMISLFDSQRKANLLVQLKLQIQKLKINCEKEDRKTLKKKLEHIVRQVKENFISDEDDDLTSNYFSYFRFNAHNLKNRTVQKFQDYLSNHWQTAAPQNLLNCLENLEYILQQRYQKYKREQKEYLNQVNSVWQSYLYLGEKIEIDCLSKKSSKTIYNSHNWQSIWNALYYVCEDKINTEICDWERELACKLSEQTKIYLHNLRKTDNFLKELQEYFEQQKSLTPIFVSSDYVHKKIDTVQLRKSLEVWSGHSLNQWGTSEHISTQMIREQLLVELRPIAQSTYTQFYQEAFSFVDTNNLIDDN